MKILSISLDKKILDENSENFKRQKKYAGLVNELHIVIFSKEAKQFALDNFFVYGSGGGNRLSMFLKTYKKSKEILKKDKKDDWIITTQDPFESALIGRCLSKKFKLGLNIQEHGDYFSEKYWRNESLFNFLRYYLGKFLIKKADNVRVVSQRIKNTLSKMGIDENRIIVVPVYTSIKRNYIPNISLENKHKSKPIFLTMGRLVKQKNLPLLIEAFSDVVRKFNQAILLIIGKGPEKKKLVSLTKKLKLKKNVLFVDWTDDIYSYYNLADIYVLSSNYEGWGRVIIEAAGCGLPIIMTDVGCAGEVIKSGESGLVVPIGDKKELEEAMIKLIGDKESRERLGEEAKKQISNLPNREKTLNLYKLSWEKALNKKL